MGYGDDYSDGHMGRPTASRRSHVSTASNRSYSNHAQPRGTTDFMSRSMYKSSSRDERLNRSSSSSRQYAYKMDNIQNRLAEKNNMLMSKYNEKKSERVQTGIRNNDSSRVKQTIDNYARLPNIKAHSSERKNDHNGKI